MSIFDSHVCLGGSVVPGVASNPAAIQTAMKARGIDGAVIFSAHARNVEPLAGNRILRAMLNQAPELYGCLVAHVNRVEASITAMRELMPGRKFVGMVIVGAQPGQVVTERSADELVHAYRRFGKPLFLFTPNGEAVQTALEIAKDYPVLRVILLGMGGTDWRAAIAAAHAAPNIVLETSGALDRAKLPTAVQAIGAHRLLFGSGSPHLDAAAALGLVEDSCLSEAARRRILSENAYRLFGLGSAAEERPEEIGRVGEDSG